MSFLNTGFHYTTPEEENIMPIYEEKPSKVTSRTSTDDQIYYGDFPSSFKFGTSSVAHQIEGTWNGDGKGLSVWDEFSRSQPKCISDRSTATEACDSYHKFEDDVLLLKSMNANSYSFSLSWPRLLPEGTTDKINEQGVDYYDDLINTLLENGIEPIVTIYFWDIPHPLLNKHAGGWMNPDFISTFESYAKFCFEKFGDRVQRWITIAQPWLHSWKSYGSGVHPPNVCLGNKGALSANTNLLKAHAKVYRLYEKEFKAKQNGSVGISFRINDNEDTTIIQLGRVLYPLVYGEYPSFVLKTMEKSSINCPQISDEWTSALKDSFDFLGVNFSCHVSSPDAASMPSASTMTIRNLLNILKSEFGNPKVLVFSEGPPMMPPFEAMDTDRAQYFSKTANDILKSIDFDQCNVDGYFPGKLMDCWEWESGFTVSYGLHQVNIFHPAKRRSPRASVAFMLKQLFKTKKFEPVVNLE